MLRTNIITSWLQGAIGSKADIKSQVHSFYRTRHWFWLLSSSRARSKRMMNRPCLMFHAWCSETLSLCTCCSSHMGLCITIFASLILGILSVTVHVFYVPKTHFPSLIYCGRLVRADAWLLTDVVQCCHAKSVAWTNRVISPGFIMWATVLWLFGCLASLDGPLVTNSRFSQTANLSTSISSCALLKPSLPSRVERGETVNTPLWGGGMAHTYIHA